MSLTPGPSGEYEVVLRAGRRRIWAVRLRSAAHSGRIRLGRLQRWLGTPEGRHAAARAGRVLAVAAAVTGTIVMMRRWGRSIRSALAVLSAGYRAAAGAVGAAADAVRFALSLGWLSRLLRWSSATRAPGAHRPCPDCHTRIRSDARVCYRCGSRELAPHSHRPFALLRGTWRVLALRRYHRCPDCRRLLHADARVCRSCGYRLSG